MLFNMSLNLNEEWRHLRRQFKGLMEQHYKEPVNGQFEDCTKEQEVLPGVETERSSDEEDQNPGTITTE